METEPVHNENTKVISFYLPAEKVVIPLSILFALAFLGGLFFLAYKASANPSQNISPTPTPPGLSSFGNNESNQKNVQGAATTIQQDGPERLTLSPTVSQTPSPLPETPSPTPTVKPTPTNTPTAAPTSIPAVIPTLTPTQAPTATPTATISADITYSPTASSSP